MKYLISPEDTLKMRLLFCYEALTLELMEHVIKYVLKEINKATLEIHLGLNNPFSKYTSLLPKKFLRRLSVLL